MNKELLAALKLAKTGQDHKFAMVMKGALPVGLLLNKKTITSGDMLNAKTAAKGSAVVEGVVMGGKGGGLKFQVADKALPCKELALKEFIKKETELVVDVEMIAELESTPQPAPTSGKEEAFDSNAALKKLKSRLNEVTPDILKAVKAVPAKKEALLKVVKSVNDLFDEKDVGKPAIEEAEKALHDVHRQARIDTAEAQRLEYVTRMGPRYDALLSEDIGYNKDRYLERLTDLRKMWNPLQSPISMPDNADAYAGKQESMDAEFRELLTLSDVVRKARAEATSDVVSGADSLAVDLEALKNAKVNGVPVLPAGTDKRIAAVRAYKPEDWSSESKFADALKEIDELVAITKPAKEKLRAAREEQLKSGEIKLSFDGTEMGEEAVKTRIKESLPQNGHGNLNQSFNDVLLGRGKATTNHAGVLHASAGKPGAAGGCTLFFTRDPKGNLNVVGVGQHKTSTSYNIYYGLGLVGKVLDL